MSAPLLHLPLPSASAASQQLSEIARIATRLSPRLIRPGAACPRGIGEQIAAAHTMLRRLETEMALAGIRP